MPPWEHQPALPPPSMPSRSPPSFLPAAEGTPLRIGRWRCWLVWSEKWGCLKAVGKGWQWKGLVALEGQEIAISSSRLCLQSRRVLLLNQTKWKGCWDRSKWLIVLSASGIAWFTSCGSVISRRKLHVYRDSRKGLKAGYGILWLIAWCAVSFIVYLSLFISCNWLHFGLG